MTLKSLQMRSVKTLFKNVRRRRHPCISVTHSVSVYVGDNACLHVCVKVKKQMSGNPLSLQAEWWMQVKRAWRNWDYTVWVLLSRWHFSVHQISKINGQDLTQILTKIKIIKLLGNEDKSLIELFMSLINLVRGTSFTTGHWGMGRPSLGATSITWCPGNCVWRGTVKYPSSTSSPDPQALN